MSWLLVVVDVLSFARCLCYPQDLRKELVKQVREIIGPIATPDAIHWAPGLPKTRSGKIMRRILRKIANKEEDSLVRPWCSRLRR